MTADAYPYGDRTYWQNRALYAEALVKEYAKFDSFLAVHGCYGEMQFIATEDLPQRDAAGWIWPHPDPQP